MLERFLVPAKHTRPTVVNPARVPEPRSGGNTGVLRGFNVCEDWLSKLKVPTLPVKDCVVLYESRFYFSPDVSQIDCAAFSAEVEHLLNAADAYKRTLLFSLLPIYEWDGVNKCYVELAEGGTGFRDVVPDIYHTKLYVNIDTYNATMVYEELSSLVRVWVSPDERSHHAVLDLTVYDVSLLHRISFGGHLYVSRPLLSFYVDSTALIADIPEPWFDKTKSFGLAQRGLDYTLPPSLPLANSAPLQSLPTIPAPRSYPIFELPEWTSNFDYISTVNIKVTYTAKRKSTYHDCFKYARYRFCDMLAEEDSSLNYVGPSRTFVEKYYPNTVHGPVYHEFKLSKSKKDYSSLLVVPVRPGRYELFDGEGYAVRETTGEVTLYLRGSKHVIFQDYYPTDAFRPIMPAMSGSFRPLDHVRVGVDVFFVLYFYSPKMAQQSTDLGVLDSVGVEYGPYVDLMLYRHDINVMQQWISSGLNGDKFKRDPYGCTKAISCYFSAVYGTSLVLREGPDSHQYIQLCGYVHKRQLISHLEPRLETIAIRDPTTFSEQLISGRAIARSERILYKNERINKKTLMPTHVFSRIKSCWKQWRGKDATLTSVRPLDHAANYNPHKFFMSHFNTARVLTGLPELLAKKALKNPDVYKEYSTAVHEANALKQVRSNYFLMAGAHRPEAVLVDLTTEQKAQVANPLPYPVQGEFKVNPPLHNPVQYQDIDPYYFPMNPARAPQHKLEGLEWALSIRQLRPLAVPELNNPIYKEFEQFMSTFEPRIRNVPILSFEEYLEGVESNKRASYRKGWEKFLETGKCPIAYNLLAKPYENQYKPQENENKLKTRLIFNPSYELKAFGGYLSKLLTLAFKEIFPEMCLHQTPGGMKRRLIRQMRHFQNPRFMMWDGARHDAHQSRPLISITDVPLQLKVLMIVGPINGFNPHMMEVAKRIICQLHAFYMVKARTPGNKDRNIDPLCIQGTVDGTVFSGHPLRTTLGNSSRITLVVRFIASKAGVLYYRANQSGDDTCNLFEESDILPFYDVFVKVYGEEGQTSPLGLVYSDFSVSGEKIDFLGKCGRVFGKGALMDLERPIGKIHTFAWYYEHLKNRSEVGQGIRDYIKRNYGRLEYEDIIIRYPTSTKAIELKWCQYEFDAEEALAEIPTLEEHIPFIPLAGVPSQSNNNNRFIMPKQVVATSNKGKMPNRPQIAKIVKKEVKKDLKRKPKSFLRRGLEGAAKFAGGRFGFGDEAQWLASAGLDYLGVGAYKFADGTVQGTPPPTRIKKIEFVKNVVSTTSFTVASNLINPTNANLFPWLSQIAPAYQRFRFNSLVFHYKTTCGSAISSTNNALGVVGMVANYDPDAASFVTKQAAEATGKCRTSVPSASFYWGMECKKSMRTYPWYFTFTTASATKDTKLLYPAKFNLFTDGMQAAGITLGELWVEYDITLMDTVQTIPGTEASSDIYSFSGATATAPTTATKSLVASNIGTSYATGLLSIPAGASSGYYQFEWFTNFSSAIATNLSVTPSSNLTVANIGPSSVSFVLSPEAGATAAQKSLTVVYFKSDNNAATIALGFSASATYNNAWISFASVYAPILTVSREYAQAQELSRLMAQYANVFNFQMHSIQEDEPSESFSESVMEEDSRDARCICSRCVEL